MADNHKHALVDGDPFRDGLLRAMGIDPKIAGDLIIEAKAAGVYAMQVWLWIPQEAWNSAHIAASQAAQQPEEKAQDVLIPEVHEGPTRVTRRWVPDGR